MPEFEDDEVLEQLDSFIGIGGQKRFRCPECEFDSYTEQLVLTHWLGTHNISTPGAPASTLYDAEDKLIEVPRNIIVPPTLRKLI